MLRSIFFPLIIFISLASCHRNVQPRPAETINKNTGTKMESIKITSTAFNDGSAIPSRHKCDGTDASPALDWTAVPDQAKTLALICDDPDAPAGTWVHWVLFNLPASTKNLAEGVPGQETLASGAKQGKNSFGKIGYNGPCPPKGSVHRYFFKLYALDTDLNLAPGVTKDQLTRAMDGHVLAEGQLMGRFQH